MNDITKLELTQQSLPNELPNEVIHCIPVFIYSNDQVGANYVWSKIACGMRKCLD